MAPRKRGELDATIREQVWESAFTSRLLLAFCQT
jgi:hypothetical protein